MVPPGDIFGVIPVWIGVFLALIVTQTLAGYLAYRRVFHLIRQGRSVPRFDHPWQRFTGALGIVLAQRKVLQRVGTLDARSRTIDLAGLGHAFVFWGFLSFSLSYAVFIFGGSLWHPLGETLLTATGVKIYSIYLDLYAALILVVMAWALVRRWAVRPFRLSFDLTRSLDSIIVVSLTAALMVATLLVHGFYVAAAGTGPEAGVIIGGILGRAFSAMGLSTGVAVALHAIFWWLHLGIILGFGIYVPTSKHIHMIGAPLNAYFRSLDPRGTLAPIDLENAERFGAGRVQDFTWKQLLDGYACAVCGRCTDACPANITGKILSPMHIVENLKEHMLTIGHQGPRDPEHVEPNPIIDHAIPEQAIWDCVSCGACMEECPVVVEHIPTIMDLRRNLVLEESKIPETGMNALLSMEQRGHPWRGTNTPAPTGPRG